MIPAPVVYQADSPDACWFRHEILSWFTVNQRSFPWRKQHDAYAVLIAELMLRRTHARQVAPIYKAFLKQFPSVSALADAPADQVLQCLWSLGLAWRAQNFQQIAARIVIDYQGKVPCDRAQLLTLPGVGPYVADAVRIFACSLSGVLIDTNTVRIASRYYGFPTNDNSRRTIAVRSAITSLVDDDAPRALNLALIDFAALVCVARRPHCDICPVSAHCSYFRSGSPDHQPAPPNPHSER